MELHEHNRDVELSVLPMAAEQVAHEVAAVQVAQVYWHLTQGDPIYKNEFGLARNVGFS